MRYAADIIKIWRFFSLKSKLIRNKKAPAELTTETRFVLMVPEAGVEPAQPQSRGILSTKSLLNPAYRSSSDTSEQYFSLGGDGEHFETHTQSGLINMLLQEFVEGKQLN